MRIRTVLVLVLVLVLLTPILSSFYYTQFEGFSYQTGTTGGSVLVVMKEAYIFARVEITISPYQNVAVRSQNGTTTVMNEMVSLQFENGTTRTLSSQTTLSFLLPNSVAFTLTRVGTGGPGFSLDPSTPIAGSLLTGNDTQDLPGLLGVGGVDTFYLRINGDAQVSVSALGIPA